MPFRLECHDVVGCKNRRNLVVFGVFTLIVTVVLIKLVGLITPLRVDAETETQRWP